MTEITRDELVRRIGDPSLSIVDARSSIMYAEEHLPGAINLPVDEIGALAERLLPNHAAEIGVYCSSFT